MGPRHAALRVGHLDIVAYLLRQGAGTGCSLNIIFFVINLNSASPAAALVFLPAWCLHTLTPRENRDRPESGIFENLRKKHNI